MHGYTVVDVVGSDQHCALWLADKLGQHHVARATAAVPPVGTRLLGNAPALGFGLLLGARMDQVFRVVFEAVHCSGEEARQSIYGSITF